MRKLSDKEKAELQAKMERERRHRVRRIAGQSEEEASFEKHRMNLKREVELSPEERRRIYEEEKARLEAQRKLKRDRSQRVVVGCLGATLTVVLFLVIVLIVAEISDSKYRKSHYYSPPSTHTSPQSSSSNLAHPSPGVSTRRSRSDLLSATDNGYRWHNASYEARKSLCRDIAQRIGKHNWKHYYDAIDAFYKTTDPMILSQKIASIAGIVSVVPSEEKQRESLVDAISKGKISLRDQEIYNYLQNR